MQRSPHLSKQSVAQYYAFNWLVKCSYLKYHHHIAKSLHIYQLVLPWWWWCFHPPHSFLPHMSCLCHNLLFRLSVQPRWKRLQHWLHQVQDQGHGDGHSVVWDHQAALYRWVTVLLFVWIESVLNKKLQIQNKDNSSSLSNVDESMNKNVLKQLHVVFILYNCV